MHTYINNTHALEGAAIQRANSESVQHNRYNNPSILQIKI